MRPKVNIRCVADRYADQRRERIVEFFDREAHAGGLISLRRVNGNLRIELYNLDENVIVSVPAGHLAEDAE